MNSFNLNNYIWHIQFVNSNDTRLVDRTGSFTVATTDPNTMTVYISNRLSGSYLTKVLIHEIAHCVLFSFNLLYDIHRLVRPENWIEAEEWTCNLIANYGIMIYSIAYNLLGDRAIYIVPSEIERYFGRDF